MARFGLAVEVWCDAFGRGTVGSGEAVKLRSVEIGQVRFGLSSYGGRGTFRQVMVRCIAVCFGGLVASGQGQSRSVSAGRSRLAAVRFGAACFGRSRTRCGGLGMVRSVWLRSDGQGQICRGWVRTGLTG